MGEEDAWGENEGPILSLPSSHLNVMQLQGKRSMSSYLELGSVTASPLRFRRGGIWVGKLDRIGLLDWDVFVCVFMCLPVFCNFGQ